MKTSFLLMNKSIQRTITSFDVKKEELDLFLN